MKNLIFILLTALTMQKAFSQDFNKSMQEIMTNMKAYTLEMMELMPEEKFDYRPTESVRTFRKQLQHTISTHYFLMNHYLKGDGKQDVQSLIQKAQAYADKTTKLELLQLLREQFDESILFFKNGTKKLYKKTYDFGTPEKPEVKDYFTAAMLIRDHIGHHRSQLIVYLRLNNIEPAPFRGF